MKVSLLQRRSERTGIHYSVLGLTDVARQTLRRVGHLCSSGAAGEVVRDTTENTDAQRKLRERETNHK